MNPMPKLLITGGTGYLGRSLAIKLRTRFDIRLTGRNNKQNLHASQITGCQTIPMDVSSIESVRDAFVAFRPDIVVHAAATKFVDLAEREPMECIDVNVVGSQNVCRVAAQLGVKDVIAISTDKAAPPVRNTYGLSKAIMERIFCGMNGKTDSRFTCVRYGNVAWSTGSVLPIWKQMHVSTGVIGTTGPEMTRFFFTVHEAVALIEAAIENMSTVSGKVLSREMKSARIKDILELWILEKGGRWEQIPGRPGERPQEFLIGETELPYTSRLFIQGVEHYLIDFNNKAAEPLQDVIQSDTSARLTQEEMLRLISPSEDLLV